MMIPTFIESRPSEEASLVGLLTLTVGRVNKKGRILPESVKTIDRPSRLYFPNGNHSHRVGMTIRSHSSGLSWNYRDRHVMLLGGLDMKGNPVSVKVSRHLDQPVKVTFTPAPESQPTLF